MNSLELQLIPVSLIGPLLFLVVGAVHRLRITSNSRCQPRGAMERELVVYKLVGLLAGVFVSAAAIVGIAGANRDLLKSASVGTVVLSIGSWLLFVSDSGPQRMNQSQVHEAATPMRLMTKRILIGVFGIACFSLAVTPKDWGWGVRAVFSLVIVGWYLIGSLAVKLAFRVSDNRSRGG